MSGSLWKQKYLGRRGLIALIISLNVVMMISTDMYLPALPHMSEVFNVSVGLINLTLVGFLSSMPSAFFFSGR